MTAFESTRLILFSGLAADANVFAPQKIAFPQLEVPAWPIPSSGESLSEYCQRLAGELAADGPCVIGGASFGGVIAQEISRSMQPLAVILIGSIRSPSELPAYVRCLRPFRFLVPLIPVRLLQIIIAPATCNLARKTTPHLWGLARQFRGSDPRVLKWSLQRTLDWRLAPKVDCPVYQIHGDRDFVLPFKLTHPDRVVRGGGHVISLTHPTEVNQYIRHVLDQVADKPSDAAAGMS